MHVRLPLHGTELPAWGQLLWGQHTRACARGPSSQLRARIQFVLVCKVRASLTGLDTPLCPTTCCVRCESNFPTLIPCATRRPFGTSTLLAAYDDSGPQLYLVEPSGNCHVRTVLTPREPACMRFTRESWQVIAHTGRFPGYTLQLFSYFWSVALVSQALVCMRRGSSVRPWARGGRRPRRRSSG